MPRVPIPPGTWGKITRTQLAPGKWRARARYRDDAGYMHLVEASGPTGAASQRALEAKLRAMTVGAADEVGPDMRLDALCQLTMDDKARHITPQSLVTYRSAADRIVAGLGQLRIREVTTGRLDRFLQSIPAASTAKRCRVILSDMFGLAMRHDAIHRNPVTDAARAVRKPRKPVKSLTADQARALRVSIREWVDDPEQARKRRHRQLPDAIDVLLGTGLRIGELLGLRWEDVDLSAVTPTLTVTGTAVAVPRLTRQDHPKSARSYRTVPLPPFVVDVLMRRRVDAAAGAVYVFPSERGSIQSPHNFRTMLRDFTDARPEIAKLTPHLLRATVGTAVDDAHGVEAARDLLGHTSAQVTEQHYVNRVHRAPNVTATLAEFVEIDGKTMDHLIRGA